MPFRVLAGGALLFAAMVVVAIASYYSNRELYFTVDELAPRLAEFRAGEPAGALLSRGAAARPARRLQVRGTVDRETLSRGEDGTAMRFDLVGATGRLPVVYLGVVPDTFESAQTVTVAGWVGSDGAFAADEVFVQCPSKYEPAVPTPAASLRPSGAAPARA